MKRKEKKMTLQESNQRLAEFADTQLDLNRCNKYYSKISDGYYSYIKEANNFADEKYAELSATDHDIILAYNVVASIIRVPSNDVGYVLTKLSWIYVLLKAKQFKDLANNR